MTFPRHEESGSSNEEYVTLLLGKWPLDEAEANAAEWQNNVPGSHKIVRTVGDLPEGVKTALKLGVIS